METKTEIEVSKHYVTFYSPGTMVSETSVKEIDSWDVECATKMALEIKERHGATPYGFRFKTKGRAKGEMDSKEIESSPMYYLGGIVKTLAEVEAINDPGDRILISNMKCNGYDRIIENNNSWKITLPLNDDDVILEF